MRKGYLTTSQAAKICNVTRFTIRNWINNGKLDSEKTIGGHRRIIEKDFKEFLQKHHLGQNGEDVSRQADIPYCWDSFGPEDSHQCKHCAVLKVKAKQCFLVRSEMGLGKTPCHTDCKNCEYLKTYYPEERSLLCRRAEEMTVSELAGTQHDEPAKNRLFYKGLYNSGKYIASVKKVFSKKQPSKGREELYRSKIKEKEELNQREPYS